MNHNYQKELESILQQEKTRGQRLLLHSCCAPCSSYVLSYLQHDFRITVFYFNPNITQAEEYERRAAEQARLIGIMNEERKEEQTRGKGRETFPIGIWQGESGVGIVFPCDWKRRQGWQGNRDLTILRPR